MVASRPIGRHVRVGRVASGICHRYYDCPTDSNFFAVGDWSHWREVSDIELRSHKVAPLVSDNLQACVRVPQQNIPDIA